MMFASSSTGPQPPPPQLGILPIPSCIASVTTTGAIQSPLSSLMAATGSVPPTSLDATQVPSQLSEPFTPQYQPHLFPWSYPFSPLQPQGPGSQPGLSLSPAAEPIPSSLVQRIKSGQFVEMRDLMADNIGLIHQLSSLQGHFPVTLGARPRLREVPSLVSWLYCFVTYTAVRTTDPLTRDMLSYARIMIREALRHGGDGWVEYDRVFRKQVALNPDLPWNSLLPSLQAATILGQQSQGSGFFCTLCRGCDHQAADCALATIEQPLRTIQPTGQSRRMTDGSRPPNSRWPKRPETIQGICIAWNKGSCYRPRCSFKHVCATCQLAHKAIDCSSTPMGSEYRRQPQTAVHQPFNRPPTANQ